MRLAARLLARTTLARLAWRLLAPGVPTPPGHRVSAFFAWSPPAHSAPTPPAPRAPAAPAPTDFAARKPPTIRPALAATALALTCTSVAAEPTCHTSPTAAPAIARLRTAMANGRFIAYEPTSLQVIYGKATQADPGSIRADLQTLRSRFDSLITYDSTHGAEAIPAIAESLKFRALIVGVWDPFNPSELNAAISAARAHPTLLVGISLGNEMLFFHRHSATELTALLDTLHSRLPAVPLTTTEPFHIFSEPAAAPILQRIDFLLPIVHPIFQPWFPTATDQDTSRFVVDVTSNLATTYCGPILVKETGIPTAPAEKGFTQRRQASFYQALTKRLPPTVDHAFAYFAAFDAPWRLNDTGPAPDQRPQPEEAHWGLYDEKRQPKPVVAQISPLR